MMKKVKNSRARRVESQRSIQAKIMRMKSMLHTARAIAAMNAIAASDGWASAMPSAAASSAMVPMTVEALSSPRKRRTVR